MKYKKIEFTPSGEITGKRGTKTFSAIKKACAVLKEDFSSGTTKMANAWVDGGSQKKTGKTKILKDQSIAMLKNITSGMKKSFKGVTPKSAVCDISYELGGVIKKTKDVFNEYIDDITRIPNGK